MSLLSESKRFDDFTSVEQNQIFDIFTQSYIKATGSSWDRNKFYSRASEWLFFGDPTGFVTVRPQRSGYYKLTGIAGNMKSILKGLQELNATSYPIWGMMTPELASILIKRYGYRMPNKLEGYIIGKLISSSVFGNVEHTRNKDGSITFKYADVGEATKVFVGNDAYYKKARRDAWNTGMQKIGLREGEEEIVDEGRAVKDYYVNNKKMLMDYLNTYGYEDTYVSFRKTLNTTYINRSNSYDTPTGFYVYPLKNFKEKIQSSSFKDLQGFMSLFPYTPDSKFIFIFSFYSTTNIIFSSTCTTEVTLPYVKKIEQMYGQKSSIKHICDTYQNNTFFSRISDERVRNFKSEFQRFWLFIYEVAYELKNREDKYNPDGYLNKYPHVFTNICMNLRIVGFIDDACQSVIHSNEPCQGVIFQEFRNNMKDLKTIPIYERYDAPHEIDKQSDEFDEKRNPQEYKRKYQVYLAKQMGFKQAVTIWSPNYQELIKQRKPFIIMSESIPYYVDKMGRRDVSGLNPNEFLDKDENDVNDYYLTQRTAYINSLYNTNYYQVQPFGQYAENIAVASSYDGDVTFIDKEGKPNLGTINLDNVKGHGSTLAAYFNQKSGKKEFSNIDIVKLNDETKGLIATLSLNGQKIFINQEGEPDLSTVNYNTLTSDVMRAYYINQMMGKSQYSVVYKAGQYGGESAILARVNKGHSEGIPDWLEYVFIDSHGNPNMSNVDVTQISDAGIRTSAINQLLGERKYYEVRMFNKFGQGLSLATAIDGTKKFINTKGEPDISAINVEEVEDDETARTAYYNTKLGTNYASIGRFDNDVSVASKSSGGYDFIDREGNDATNKVNVNSFTDSYIRAVYLNKVLGTDYRYVTPFNQFADGIAYAIDNNDKGTFINLKGEPDTSTIDPTKIEDSGMRTQFINQRYNKDYKQIRPFGEYAENIATARTPDSKRIFIDTTGEPSLKGIDVNELGSGEMRAAYYNQLLGTDFYEVQPYGQYGDPNIALATSSDGKKMFINREGKPDTGLIDVSKISNDSTLRTAFFNEKFGTDYQNISPFSYGKDKNIAVATTDDDKKIFVNKEGKPDVNGVVLNDFHIDEKLRAALINQKFGRNYNAVYAFDVYGKNIALANIDNKTIFINNRGVKTLNGIDLEKVNQNDNARTAYYNQKFKKDYARVRQFNEKGIALAHKKNYGKEFITIDGQPADINDINLEELIKSNDYETLASVFNTKFGTDYTDVIPSRLDKHIPNARTVFFGKEKNIGGDKTTYILFDINGKLGVTQKEKEALYNEYSQSTIDPIIKNTEFYKKELAKKKKAEKKTKITENFSDIESLVYEELINFIEK